MPSRPEVCSCAFCPHPRVLHSFVPVVWCVALLLVAHQVSVIRVNAQSATATLSGTVTDPNGALVPGVNVALISTAQGFQRNTISNDEGAFVIPLLPPGVYTLKAEHEGFMPAELRNVVLNVNSQVKLNIPLKIRLADQTVDIIDAPTLIDESPAVGTTVDRQFVSNLPLNGRSFQSLIGLTPGIVFVPTSATNNTGQFSVNGHRGNANNFTVDGVSANVANGLGSTIGQSTSGSLPALTTFGGTNSLVSVEALQEFKVETSTYAAEYGRTPGAQISIATRSGENDFHGVLFDYLRNEQLDANDWFLNARGISKRPPLRQNDFGGVFSGPALLPRFGEGGRQPLYNGHNKSFFYLSYEGLRLLTPTFTLTNVPSLTLRQTAAAAFRPILNSFPLPNGPNLSNGFAEFAAGYSNSHTLNATSIRIDHTLSSKFVLFGRYNSAPSQSESRSLPNLAVITSRSFDTRTLTGGATMVFSPIFSNELRANYSTNAGTSETTQDSFGGAVPLPREALLPAQYAPTGSGSNAAYVIGGFPGFTATTPIVEISDFAATQRQVNIVDNVSFTKGNHQLKFGADYRRLMPIQSPRSYILVAQFTSVPSVQTGSATLVVIGRGTPSRPIYDGFSAFAQDAWKLSQGLTLHFGLRWELNPAPHEANGNDPFAINGIENLAALDLAPQGTPLWKTTYDNFAPRLGVSYQLSRTPGRETVLRGGFGVFYDAGNSQGSASFEGIPFNPARTQFNLTLSDPRFVLPFATDLIAPATYNRNPPYVDPAQAQEVIAFDPNLKLPYALEWSFAAEQSIGRNQTITASYVAAAGRRLLAQQRFNLSGVNPRFPTLRLMTNDASSDYHSLQIQAQRRLARGLQALGSYTWSHAIDTVSTDVFASSSVLIRGNSDFDVRHNVAAAVTYDIPGGNANSFANAITRGWGVDTRFNARTALPVLTSGNTYNITSGTLIDPSTGQQVARRANLIAGVPVYLNDPSVPGGRIINRAAFSVPLTGQQGTLGRNIIRGFPFWQVDMAVRRRFKLTDKLALQFRAEAFNVLNHPNFGTIQTSLTSPTFGRATEMLNTRLSGLNPLYQIGGPRSMQFALKLQF